MKVFALIMLRCTLIMLWFSLVQNGTLATLAKWETSFRSLVDGIFTAAETPLDKFITKRIRTEFNTFMFELQLELIKVNWTSGNKKELAVKLLNLAKSSTNSYIDVACFVKEWQQIPGSTAKPGTPEFVDFVESLILNAKLKILETELRAKIAGFVPQQPFIDGDAFIELSERFIDEWNEIQQNINKLTNKNTLRKKLNDLAEIAMNETAPLKSIMTKKLGQLITKCQNVEQIKNIASSEIPIISESKFSGAVYDELSNFDEAIHNANFCAELETAVEKDKEMVATAYQVKKNLVDE
uniref:Uncharacterized protein n=1 Tax=Globodera rostochiensis TaxID=31243 RepID=A0A914HJ06_GLORO